MARCPSGGGQSGLSPGPWRRGLGVHIQSPHSWLGWEGGVPRGEAQNWVSSPGASVPLSRGGRPSLRSVLLSVSPRGRDGAPGEGTEPQCQLQTLSWVLSCFYL